MGRPHLRSSLTRPFSAPLSLKAVASVLVIFSVYQFFIATLLPIFQYHCLHTALSLAFHFQALVTDAHFFSPLLSEMPHMLSSTPAVCIFDVSFCLTHSCASCTNDSIVHYNAVYGRFGRDNYRSS